MNALSMTLEQITNGYYLPEKRKRRKPGTVYGYESSINLHVLPKWGESTITEITHDAVQEWVDELSISKAGIGGAKKAYKCLRQIIRWAMDKWSLCIADPTRKIEFERQPQYKPETLTQRRLKKLIRGMVGCVLEPTAILQCALGIRPSENYALHWEYINWRTGVVHIGSSLHELPNLIYESTTKTAKGERDAYLAPWALDRLNEIWVSRGRPKGRIIGDAKPSKVFRLLKRWAIDHKLPWVGMKNLRHTWGTIAARNNPIEVVAAMMGHTSIQLTYRYYYQLTLSAMRRVQRKVARSILGKTSDDMYKGVLMPQSSYALPRAA